MLIQARKECQHHLHALLLGTQKNLKIDTPSPSEDMLKETIAIPFVPRLGILKRNHASKNMYSNLTPESTFLYVNI